MANTSRSRYFILGAISTVVLFPLAIRAIETIPLTFSEGDVISAGVMNQIFDRINAATSTPKAASLVGEWTCVEARADCSPNSGWIPDSSGLYCTRVQNIVFSAGAGPGRLTLNTEKGFPLRSNGYEGVAPLQNVSAVLVPETRLLTFVHSYASVDVDQFTGATSTSTKTVRGTFRVSFYGREVFEWEEIAQANSGTCSRTSAPPAPVDALKVLVNGADAVLTWMDTSALEEGYKVQRKNSPQGAWTTLAALSANSTSYSDRALVRGVYWYRVISVNRYGDSMSSSEVSVTIP